MLYPSTLFVIFAYYKYCFPLVQLLYIVVYQLFFIVLYFTLFLIPCSWATRIFTIFVSFQGVAIFILFVPLSKPVRDAYSKWWKEKLTKHWRQNIKVSLSNRTVYNYSDVWLYIILHFRAPLSSVSAPDSVLPLHPWTVRWNWSLIIIFSNLAMEKESGAQLRRCL